MWSLLWGRLFHVGLGPGGGEATWSIKPGPRMKKDGWEGEGCNESGEARNILRQDDPPCQQLEGKVS